MFGLLKKKIGDFIGKLTSKEEEKADDEKTEAEEEKVQAGKAEGQTTQEVQKIRQQKTEEPKTQEPKPQETTPYALQPKEGHSGAEEKPVLPVEEKRPVAPAVKPVEIPEKIETFAQDSARIAERPIAQIPVVGKKAEPVFPTVEKKQPSVPAPASTKKTEPTSTPSVFRPSKPDASFAPEADDAPVSAKPALPLSEPKSERKMEAKIGLLSKIKSVFTNEVQIQEGEIAPLLDDLHWAMLESDVSLDTAEHISNRLKVNLVGARIEKGKLNEKVRQAVRTVLVETLSSQTLDLAGLVREREKPVKILFLGPNGAGKTTTIAKIAHYLRSQGITCVLAAGDTFRAAAIEQLTHHATKIGVKIVKHQYAADPAAVAFDAIAHAKTHHVDVVLIDTAGRQETNTNLLREMEKINRVIKPDLKLFVGEAVSGHALVEQVHAFHAALNLDGIVLTKLDCDAKGGTSFSLAHELKLPIVFMGTGQGYDDLRPFDPNWIVDNVLAE